MIETSRLSLYQPKSEDFLIIEHLYKNKEIRQFLGGIVSDQCIKKKIIQIQNHWNHYQFGQYIVLHKTSKEITGLCGLIHSKDGIELSYMFFPKFWGKGFAFEAVKAMISYAFNNLNLNKIIAITQKSNIRSCQLLQKIGMKYVKSLNRFNAIQSLYLINKN